MASTKGLSIAVNLVRARKADFAPIDLVGVLSLLLSGLLIIATGLVLTTPELRLVANEPSLSPLLECFGAIVAFGVFYVSLARFISDGRYSELCVALAFLAFSGASFVYGIALPLLGGGLSHAAELRVYGALATRLGGGMLLVLGYFLSEYRASRRQRAFRGLALSAVLVEVEVAVGLLLYHQRERLTALALASARTAGSDFGSLQTTWELSIVLTFMVGAFAYYLSYRQSHDLVTGCLSMGLIIASFSELHLMAYPLAARLLVTNGDWLRLCSYLVLLVGLSSDYMQSFLRLQTKHRELEALYRVATVPVAKRNLKAALEEIAATICACLPAERAAALLYDAETEGLDVLPPVSTGGETTRLSSSVAGPALTAIRQRITVHCPGGPQDEWLAQALGLPEVRQAILVPLEGEKGALGALVAANGGQGRFGREEERLLQVMAARTAMVVENTRLYDYVEAAAAMEERIQLAREVHDGLAQNLSYLNLKLGRLLSRHQLSEPQASELEEIRKATEEALAEARQSIAAWRTTPTDEGRFVDTLQKYAEEFASDHDIEVSMVKGEGLPSLRPQAQAEVLRIVQEALNNIRKHAGANHVQISLLPSGQNLVVRVQDDGKGLSGSEKGKAEGRHYGLTGMRERARRLGGELRLHSEPGKGTMVEVEVPIWN